jgi:hypothetical protein
VPCWELKGFHEYMIIRRIWGGEQRREGIGECPFDREAFVLNGGLFTLLNKRKVYDC